MSIEIDAPIARNPADVQVHGPRADRAAARQRNVGVSEAAEQRSEHEDRRAHRLHELVRREELLDARGVDDDAAVVAMLGGHAHALEQLQRRRDVVQLRDVAERHRAVGEQRGGQESAAPRSSRRRFELRRRAAVPPTIASLSMARPLAPHARSPASWRARLRLFGRQRRERQRVNLAAHARTERAVHHLMSLQAALTGKRRADHAWPRNDPDRPFHLSL